jgi:two-component system sensor histidine kinase DesK
MARGERPRGGVWTLLALAVLAYAPIPWAGTNWASAAFPLVASVPMVLRGRLAALVIAGPYVYLAVTVAQLISAHPTPANYFFELTYAVGTSAIVPTTLYASARLARVADELRATQSALAQAAVGGERLRISRDLHDLLGHSLSAISLKGDLAIRLLRRDTMVAVAEINNLAEVARQALNGLLSITLDGGKPSLETELGSARALLADAGAAVCVTGDASGIPPAVAEGLAWAVREGVTNILRHATASTATISVECRGGLARLEILNDGAGSPGADDGHGLRGLTDRIEALSGSLSHGWLSGGRFQLAAQVPVTEENSWTASWSRADCS